MGFKEKWTEYRNSASDPQLYGEGEKTNEYKAKSALSMLYASDYCYEDWKNIGIAFKAAGGTLSDWLAWCSIDAARYEERTAAHLFENVDAEGAITANTLWKKAWDAGWDWHEQYEKLPKVKRIPKPREFDGQGAQAIAQLEAMFEPDDYVNVVTKATKNDKGKWVPSGYGKQMRCADLCDLIKTVGL